VTLIQSCKLVALSVHNRLEKVMQLVGCGVTLSDTGNCPIIYIHISQIHYLSMLRRPNHEQP
jgi:hypothetical protein